MVGLKGSVSECVRTFERQGPQGCISRPNESADFTQSHMKKQFVSIHRILNIPTDHERAYRLTSSLQKGMQVKKNS